MVGVGAVCGAFTLGTGVSRRPPLALLDASAAAACSVLLALGLIESVWARVSAAFFVWDALMTATPFPGEKIDLDVDDPRMVERSQ